MPLLPSDGWRGISFSEMQDARYLQDGDTEGADSKKGCADDAVHSPFAEGGVLVVRGLQFGHRDTKLGDRVAHFVELVHYSAYIVVRHNIP